MRQSSVPGNETRPSRRDFVRGSGAALSAAAISMSLQSAVYAAGSDALKVGLVGCGGRGTGAAQNALHGDTTATLHAMADLFPDQIESALKSIKEGSDVGDRVNVPKERRFSGLEAYKQLIDSVDVVLLATPPHFRPLHVRAAIEAGKHVFCEKPVGVDVPGVKSVMETTKLATDKKLCLVSGLCFRYDESKRETVAKIHDGAIGQITALQTNYLTTGLWYKQRQPEWSDMEWQLRDWLYFSWLSGDHIVEQHIHSLDKMLWIMKDNPPLKVIASGGRIVRTAPQFGNVYDHFNSIFEWGSVEGLAPAGVRCFSACRQWTGAQNKIDVDVSDWAFGTEGTANVQQHRITGKVKFHKGDAKVGMYDAEHVALFNAIKSGTPINNGDYMCKSTLMAIMARESAYTGKSIKWEEILASTEKLGPDNYNFGPFPTPAIPVPGMTKFT